MAVDFFSFLKKTNMTAPISGCPIEEEIEAVENSEQKKLVTEAKEATVLFVDDNRDLLDYLEDVMPEFIKEAYTARSAFEAIDLLTTKHVDAIVSDVMMPEMNGFEFCKYVKNNPIISHIPVILLTARVSNESREIGYKNGADAYVMKPFVEKELTATIDALLKSRADSKKLITETFKFTESSTFSPVDEEILNTFHCIVSENVSDPDFGVQKIEELMNMNHTVLFNKIVNLTGLNLISYINRARLEHSITLLRTTTMSMAEIAEQSGFSNQRYFSTAFKKYTGTTPLKYKSQFAEAN